MKRLVLVMLLLFTIPLFAQVDTAKYRSKYKGAQFDSLLDQVKHGIIDTNLAVKGTGAFTKPVSSGGAKVGRFRLAADTAGYAPVDFYRTSAPGIRVPDKTSAIWLTTNMDIRPNGEARASVDGSSIRMAWEQDYRTSDSYPYIWDEWWWGVSPRHTAGQLITNEWRAFGATAIRDSATGADTLLGAAFGFNGQVSIYPKIFDGSRNTFLGNSWEDSGNMLFVGGNSQINGYLTMRPVWDYFSSGINIFSRGVPGFWPQGDTATVFGANAYNRTSAINFMADTTRRTERFTGSIIPQYGMSVGAWRDVTEQGDFSFTRYRDYQTILSISSGGNSSFVDSMMTIGSTVKTGRMGFSVHAGDGWDGSFQFYTGNILGLTIRGNNGWPHTVAAEAIGAYALPGRAAAYFSFYGSDYMIGAQPKWLFQYDSSSSALYISSTNVEFLRFRSTDNSARFNTAVILVGSDTVATLAQARALGGSDHSWFKDSTATNFGKDSVTAGYVAMKSAYGNIVNGPMIGYGSSAFVTTSTRKAVYVSGMAGGDVVVVNWLGSDTEGASADEGMIKAMCKTDSIIVTRNASVTSGAGFSWIRMK